MVTWWDRVASLGKLLEGVRLHAGDFVIEEVTAGAMPLPLD